MELTILMPCLNEAETIERCIHKARAFLFQSGVDGEVLIADNGSTDGSQALATAAGARVIDVPTRGYGAALSGGIQRARGRYIIMGDADDSYDFSALAPMLASLRDGNELVMGNRFRGGIASGAMPFLHRYLGNPVLSFLGRLFYRAPIGDFHCGLRGFHRETMLRLDLSSSGMEFASEMVVKAALYRVRIAEVPVRLSRDGRSRPPHLRTWRDGWRHLRFLLISSPRWLFLIPGALLMLTGLLAMGSIGIASVTIGDLGLDIHTLSYAGAALTLGTQMVLFAIFTRIMGAQRGWLPADARTTWMLQTLTLEKCLAAGGILMLAGIGLSLHAVGIWAGQDFGPLDPRHTMRWVIPSVTLLAIGGELSVSAFALEALRYSSKNDRGHPLD
ncbi:dolichol-P-glucose synthetase [Xanthomonas sp. Mitacek01]|nr:dolichol-P-glucose synthetase [Xanthomonas sp. Mitacek01]